MTVENLACQILQVCSRSFPKLVHHLVVTVVQVDDETADRSVLFADGLRLDAFHPSSGDQGLNDNHTKGVMIVATGGGELAIWGNAR